MRHLARGLNKRRLLISVDPAGTVPKIRVARDPQPAWVHAKDPADGLIAAAGSAQGASLSWHSRDGLGPPSLRADHPRRMEGSCPRPAETTSGAPLLKRD